MNRNEITTETKEPDKNFIVEDHTDKYKSNHSEKNDFIIDKIFSQYGYSLEVWKIIITCYFILFIDGYNSTYFSSMIIPYTDLFKLKDNQVSLLGSLFYVSKGLGFLSVGQLTKYLNRIYLTKTVLLILIILGFTREINIGFNYLLFNRAFTGILVGICEILATNVLCEFLPRRFRAFTMILTWGGYAIGQFTPNIIMLYTMPNLDASGVTQTHLINSIINLVLFLIICVFFQDSPRNLILNGNEREAIYILSKMTKKDDNSFSPYVQAELISQVKDSNKISSASYKEIFGKDFILFTFCALVIFFNNNFYGDGFTLISTLILREKLRIEQNEEPGKLLRDSILMQVFNLFGNLLCALLVEIKFIGRRRSLLILMTSIITVCILSIIFMEHIAIFMSIFNLLNLVGDIMIVFTSEVYPTRIRDLGTGFINSIALSGSIISQFVFLYIFNLHFLTPFYLIIGLLSTSIIAAILIPIESFERPLDAGIININKDDCEERDISVKNRNDHQQEDSDTQSLLKNS